MVKLQKNTEILWGKATPDEPNINHDNIFDRALQKRKIPNLFGMMLQDNFSAIRNMMIKRQSM